ncbi:MAG: CBO2463/CBO2479 domain-containing protein [Eubacterium sp.]
MADYTINPVLMGGLVKDTSGDRIKIHLHGRLGVLEVPRWLIQGDTELEPGHDLEFYFSYIQVNNHPYDYDTSSLDPELELTPCLVGGKLIEVNDTAAKLEMINDLGTVAVPRRWLFTNEALEEGQNAEFYFSCMRVVGKKDIPQESI